MEEIITVEKLLKITGIHHMHFKWNSSRAINERRDRQLLAYLITPYFGILIAENLNTKNKYMAYRYVVTDEYYGHATFTKIGIGEAIKILDDYRGGDIKFSLTQDMEEKLRKAVFLEKI